MSTSAPTVAITGANGFLGAELVRHFSGKGWQVIGLVRDPGKYQPGTNVRYAAYDLSRPLEDNILDGVDYVVHTAYVKQSRAYPNAMTTNLEAARRLSTACEQAGVKKRLFLSSMSAHEEAESVYGKQKLAIEALFTGPAAASIRSGLIVGNGGIVKEMVGFMRSKHVVPLVGGGNQPLQIVGVYDLARVIEKILTSHNGRFVIGTPAVYTYKQFYQAISRQLGIKVLFVPVPFTILFGMLKLIALLHLPLAVSTDNALGLKHLRAFDTASDLKKLGVVLDDLDAVLQKTSAALRTDD